jgi:uncharacterized protein YdhG (YjbR/CyaY superfamily)
MNVIEQYINQLPAERQAVFNAIRETILKNLPPGFEEQISFGMPSYVVPHKLYPSGYHCNPNEPLPFVSLASQKNHIAIYHLGLYSNDSLKTWFVSEYAKHAKLKLDMSKSCVRFKKMDDIHYELIGELMTKISVSAWIESYEKETKR